MKVSYRVIFSLLLAFSCREKVNRGAGNTQVAEASNPINIPVFNADSAFFFIEKQVGYGPIIPGTMAHKNAGDFFVERLKSYGAAVINQEFDHRTFDNQDVRLRNIIASFYPEKKRRILLAAHWDTRPFADKDKEKPDEPFDGANDGASGVAILLELARALNNSPRRPEVGIDIILFDGEDWGESSYNRTPLPPDLESWWCLGSQYWARHKHKPDYSAYYGILLDMVGAANGKFYRESLSLSYAPKIVERVWNTAEQLGYSHFFVKQNQGEVIDDHKYVTEIAKIPMIDIVNYDPATGSFGAFHHTTADNLDLISRSTLEAVGVTLLSVIYNERESA